MNAPLDPARLRAALDTARRELLARRTPDGHWTGRLSSSALSTATAVSALSIVRNAMTPMESGILPRKALAAEPDYDTTQLGRMIRKGVDWLLANQNADGGWGDTDKSPSNISTTLLVKSALILSDISLNEPFDGEEIQNHDSVIAGWSMDVLGRADLYLRRSGGVEAVSRRYGKDKTFSAPILTNAALAGLLSWDEVPQLPFERAALPGSLFRLLRLQVVSYAIPALVAIGRVRFHYYRDRRRPIGNFLRRLAAGPTLRRIAAMQPKSGGYLEAAPLTAFVVMSLASCGHFEHRIVTEGLRFLMETVREDGSWPIDTNLATWSTSLAVTALGGKTFVDDSRADALIDWLLSCRQTSRHPYTGAAPGGWGWTDLSGAVPDGDDTPGALLALAELWPNLSDADPRRRRIRKAVRAGLRWLLGLQNADGGMPTFCRGWGMLPFDKSSTDLTAHALRAFRAWEDMPGANLDRSLLDRMDRAGQKMLRFLEKSQNADGSWFPLWFGNQNMPDDVNPYYGTAKVLQALAALGLTSENSAPVRRGIDWLVGAQGADGAWGGVEETALIVEALAVLPDNAARPAFDRGLLWLVKAVESGHWTTASPIGLYFAKLWYYEELYPLVFTTAALRAAQ